ncbi:MAG: hypothetical protein KBG48_26305 [Kofleriaceae bacterium]|jgi:hypothetical protein|nr:hypothetical protein [Kofleriaceae bacterium]MBP9170937.1 hypothetical protein [Kofleriaceae bacterium]MBP9860503.1 hypothetical protein [Kofleriaceae bacterium]
MTRAFAIAVVLSACSAPSAPTTPPRPATVDAAVEAEADAGPAVAVVAPAPAPVTDEECGRYVDHVLAVGLDAMRATKPADLIPTPEQVAESRGRLLASRPCKELPRAAWACALAARDQAALYACAEAR